jgi:hypothetical protein
LKDQQHPLRLLRKCFASELEQYHLRFGKMGKDGVVLKADVNSMTELERQTYINPLLAGGAKGTSAKQVRDFIVASVKEFIKVFKWATFKFYRIQRYMRS